MTKIVPMLLVLMVAGCASTPRQATSVAAPDALPLDRSGQALAERMVAEFARQDGKEAEVAESLAKAALLDDRPELARTALRAALRARKPTTARVMLGRWRELEPEGSLIAPYAAALALSDGKTDEALALIADRGKDQKLPTEMVEALRWLPDLDRILPFLSTLAELSPTPAAAVTYSRFAESAKAPEFARDILDTAIERMPEDAILLAYRANLVQTSQPELARADLQKAVVLKPDSRELRLSLAALEDAQGRSALAARVLAQMPNQDEELIGIELAYAARAEDTDLVKSACTRIEELAKPHPAARLQLLGTCAELIEDLDQAMIWYGQVSKDDAEYIDARIRIASIQTELKQFDAARAGIDDLRETGILRREDLVRTYLLQSEVAASEDQVKLALDALTQGLAALPDDEDLLYARSLRHELLGNIPGAEGDLRRLLEINPDNADALNALGYTLTDNTRRYDEALVLIERAMRLKPDDAAILDSMGWVKFHLGEIDEAVTLLRAAYAKQAEAEIAAHLGEALWRQGERDEARLIWREALSRQPDDAALRETLRRHGL